MRRTNLSVTRRMNPVTGSGAEASRLANCPVDRVAYYALNGGSAAERGAALWQAAVSSVQSGELDDRTLYWQRLTEVVGLSGEDAHLFETNSRNYDPVFDAEAQYRVLVTGFDPFHLDKNNEQSNPSGVIALQHDGVKIECPGGLADLRSLIVPVRFKDFDDGLIESLVEQLAASVDMIITVSMGRDAFDLERYPGRRRSSEQPDNERCYAGCSAANPVTPVRLEGPEFVEFSLPAAQMIAVTGDYAVRDNRQVTTLESGDLTAQQLSALDGQTAVNGSGGGYLSNEISYRVIHRLNQLGSSVRSGHIHVPRIAGYDADRLEAITIQARELVQVAVQSVCNQS